jgi:DNA-binding PadR family transcriptional regulator
MSQTAGQHRNVWALTVLCLLRQGSMHPYEMQRLIRQRKEEFLDLKRGSLYDAIERLHRAGLIEPVETSRQGRRPERTVYRLTGEGDKELIAWLRELLASPSSAATPFFAAVSFLAHLHPADVIKQLETRAIGMEHEVASLSAGLRAMVPRIGRLVMLESEYARAMKKAELTWVRSLIDDINTGKLVWNPGAILEALRATGPSTESVAKPTDRKPGTQ